MNDTEFKCLACGNTEDFVASCMIISGPIDVTPYGYEKRVGSGLDYMIPDDAFITCGSCGHEGTAFMFRKWATE